MTGYYLTDYSWMKLCHLNTANILFWIFHSDLNSLYFRNKIWGNFNLCSKHTSIYGPNGASAADDVTSATRVHSQQHGWTCDCTLFPQWSWYSWSAVSNRYVTNKQVWHFLKVKKKQKTKKNSSTNVSCSPDYLTFCYSVLKPYNFK